MTEIRFYHLERQGVEQALPALLFKALENGHRVVVKGDDSTRIKQLNDVLWTYDSNSFLPHGMEKDGFSEDQNVFLTSGDEVPNKADVLVLIDDAESENMGDFALCCAMFDGRNKSSVAKARAQWKMLQDQDVFEMTYWQQGERGWEKKGA